MIKIAICEDNEKIRQYLADMVRGWRPDQPKEIQEFSKAESFLFHYVEDKTYDLLLLDIEMGAMSGLDLAQKIRQEDRDIPIIFITAYMEYMDQGYDVSALHYLIKPVKREKLYQVLDRALVSIREKTSPLLIQSGDEMLRLDPADISYISVEGNYITIHAGQPYVFRKTLKEIEKDLDERFYRLGRSCLVNLVKIQKISRQEVFLLDGTVLPLPRGHYHALHQAFIAYF